MYTQIILLLFAVHSLSAYSIVQIELKNAKEVSGVKELSNNTLEFISDQSKLPTLREVIFVVDKYLENNDDKDPTIKKKTPVEIPIELDGSLRAFTNGHGFQFVNWELVDEHQVRPADKAEDKNDKNIDSDSKDADDNDNTAGDEIDKHDDNHEVQIPEIDQRHLNIDKAKTSRNKMFDKMKEKYQSKKRNHDPTEEVRRKRQLHYQNIPGGAPYNLDPTTNPDYKNRMLLNRAPYDNSKNVMSPALRDEHGNILHDNINTVYSGGRQFGNTPRAYGMNLNNDQGYPLNYINNMQNEPIHNYYINQPVQQRPIESTANNNPYKQANTPEVAVSNVQQLLPKAEINDIDNIQKFNQVTNHETINRVPKEVENKSIPQVIEIENTSNNGEVNTTTLKHNKEMLHNVNHMSKKIGNIKDKVKDRFANILNTPEGRKLLTHGMTKTGHKGQTRNDTGTPHVQVNDLASHSSNLTANDNLKVNPNNTIAINNIEDTNVMESNCSNEINDTNNSLVELSENIDIEINEIIENPVKKTVNSNTVNQNNPDPTTNQTIVQNKCENPELPATDILTTACNETAVIEKDKGVESISDPMKIERVNGTASIEIKEETCTEVEEIIEETKKETPVANKTSEKNCISEQNNTEPTTNQTNVQNKCENPELPATEILTTACNETAVIEKDKGVESTSDPMRIERLNGTASIEIKEETCTELEEIIEETKKETPVANKTSEENCDSKEKCDADDSKVDNVSENVNFDDLLSKDEFWAWLSKWTTAYMEILKVNFEVMVKEEVAKQLEEMFSKAEKEMANYSQQSNLQEELETFR